MKLHNLQPAAGSTKKRKRIGRGVGSGYGGHSSTRGNKGQKAHGNVPVWFEGGQMPLQRRLPKFGFKNPFRIEYRAVNLSRLAQLVADGALDASAITPESLAAVSVVRKGEKVKILGGGELSSALTVSAHAFSESAKARIEAAGGTVTVL
ncbi:MAG: 50S ribosomal protein L15 [Rhodothermales bacterium]|nr:50S ribosomal protein L15 [Rhodothermales bacterium]